MARERLAASEVEQHPQDVDDQEAEVLREAVGKLGQWAARLPGDSPWRDAFGVIREDVAAYLGRPRS